MRVDRRFAIKAFVFSERHSFAYIHANNAIRSGQLKSKPKGIDRAQQAEHRLLAMVIIYTSASGGLVRESPLLIVIAAKLMSHTCKADAKIKRSVA